MSELQRYAAGHEDSGMAYFYPCVPGGGGNVVLYADHLREVADLQAKLEERGRLVVVHQLSSTLRAETIQRQARIISEQEAELQRLRTENTRLKHTVGDLGGKLAKVHGENAEKDRIIAALKSKYAFSENQELCIGFSGGCDGDLDDIEHDEGCPAQLEDIKLRPHLYESSRSQEAQKGASNG